MIGRIRALCGLALVLLLAPATPCLAAAAGPGAAQQAMAKAFANRVFVALPGETQKIVLKWETPVRFGLVSREGVSSKLYYDTFARIEEVRAASGKNFLVSSDRINFLVLFSSDTAADVKTYAQQIAPFFADGVDYHGFFQDYQRQGLACAGKMLLSPARSIIAYLLFVTVSEDRSLEAVDACITRNLLRGMGVIAAPSSEGAAAGLRAGGLSRLDKQILSVLYSGAIKSGETAGEAEKAILTTPVPN